MQLNACFTTKYVCLLLGPIYPILHANMTSALCLADVNVMLVRKGSFSYKQDNANYLELDDHLIIRMERIDDIVARVYLVDAHNVQQPIPANVTMARAAGDAVPHFLNNFLISWVDSYTLYVNGQTHMVLNNQKQQAISGPPDAASGVV